MQEQKNYGFIPDKILPEDYVFGGYSPLSPEVLQPDGDWRPYLPLTEAQSRPQLETMACTSYGTLSVLETLNRRIYGTTQDYSERYIATLADTTPQGNSPHRIAETIRKVSGLVPEFLLPFNDTVTTWEQYYMDIPDHILKQGEHWLTQYELKHQWIFQTFDTVEKKHQQLKEALKYSPVGVSVFAWQEENGIYVKRGGDNHWTALVAYDGGNPIIFDSYEPYIKVLAPDYDFGFAKGYFLKKKVVDVEPKPAGYSFIKFLKRLFLKSQLCTSYAP